LSIIHGFIELYKIWQKIFPHFPTTSRHTLGYRIDNLLVEIAELLFLAQFATGNIKLSLVGKTSQKLDTTKFLLRLAWEIESMEEKKYIILSEYLQNIGKQLGGWMKYLRKENSPR